MPSPPRNTNGGKRARPCDACRRRKRRCVVDGGDRDCQLCRSVGAQCTFKAPATERGSLKRATSEHGDGRTPTKRVNHVTSPSPATETHSFGDTAGVIEDYDTLPTASLLKRNLGLQQHQYIRFVGPTDELDPNLLSLRPVDEKKETKFPNGTSCRRVSRDTHFALIPYSRTEIRAQELQDLDHIESLVRPYGKSLVELYFKIIHPSFPILDKKTFMEKYARTHREFAPPCLAGVYMLASKWWHYDRELTSHKKPDIDALERIARSSLQGVTNRPKLSTLQGGLLLLQFRGSGDEGAWALSSQLVAVAQDLGIDSDCSSWTIPVWEKDLRTRLGWAIFTMDKWMSLCRGRPSHIVDDDWTPAELSDENLIGAQDDSVPDETTIECTTDATAGGMAFKWMVSLTRIVSEILRKFYSRKALADTTSNIRTLLEQIKPVQVRLREWHRDLPPCLQADAAADPQRLSSNASLHLGYFAAEIALHRVILTSLLRHSCDPFIVQICRDAARERVTSAVDLVTSLKAQDLQAFWYFPSGYCLVTIGTFTTLLFITSQSLTEAEFYRKTLDSYRWRLRVSSPAVEYMAFAMQKLDLSLSHVHELTSADIIGHPPTQTDGVEQPLPVDTSIDTQETPTQVRKRGPKRTRRRESQGGTMRPYSRSDDVVAASSPMPFYEDAILNAINDEPLLLDATAAQQHSFLMSLLPTSPAVGALETTPRTLEFDYQHSDPG